MEQTKRNLLFTSVVLTSTLILFAAVHQASNELVGAIALAFGGTTLALIALNSCQTDSPALDYSESDSEPEELSDEAESSGTESAEPRRSPRRFFRKQCQHCGNS